MKAGEALQAMTGVAALEQADELVQLRDENARLKRLASWASWLVAAAKEGKRERLGRYDVITVTMRARIVEVIEQDLPQEATQ